MGKKIHNNSSWKCIWILSLVALAIITIVACLCAKYVQSNVATMISGALSALATVILGSIAIWQNVQYKKQSDDFHDMLMRPYISIFDSNKSADAEEIKVDYDSGGTDIKNMRIQNVGRETILKIEIVKYCINGKDYSANITSKNTMLIANQTKIICLPYLNRINQDINIEFLIKNVVGEEYTIMYALTIDESSICKKSCIIQDQRRERTI